jgi:hypothetical protein
MILPLTVMLLADSNGRPSSTSSVVRSFGSTTSPDGRKRLEVTRREKSLVEFEVLDGASGKRLASDSIGSDVMRWFL